MRSKSKFFVLGISILTALCVNSTRVNAQSAPEGRAMLDAPVTTAALEFGKCYKRQSLLGLLDKEQMNLVMKTSSVETTPFNHRNPRSVRLDTMLVAANGNGNALLLRAKDHVEGRSIECVHFSAAVSQFKMVDNRIFSDATATQEQKRLDNLRQVTVDVGYQGTSEERTQAVRACRNTGEFSRFCNDYASTVTIGYDKGNEQMTWVGRLGRHEFENPHLKQGGLIYLSRQFGASNLTGAIWAEGNDGEAYGIVTGSGWSDYQWARDLASYQNASRTYEVSAEPKSQILPD